MWRLPIRPEICIMVRITSFGRVVETLGCNEKMTVQRGESTTATLEFSGTLGFGAKGELDPNGWIESALMSVDVMIPNGTQEDIADRTEVCDLRAQTSIKLKPTFREVNINISK